MSLTPAQVETYARSRYAATGDTFWSSDDIRKLTYEGELILAMDAHVIQDKDTSITTVASTQAYSFPSNTISIRRIEYDGEKLKQISFREDDSLTFNNSTTTDEGTPQYYYLWNDTIYLRVIPNDAKTLTIYRFKEPTLLTTSSTALSIPSRYHMSLIDYVAHQMSVKDKNLKMAQYFAERWEIAVRKAKMYERKRVRSDAFMVVKDEEALSETILGST